jgi:hypothetical protein
MTGVELPRIFELEKQVTPFTIFEQPSNIQYTFVHLSNTYIERFAAQCNLTFQEIQLILRECDVANDVCENYAPQTIAAALIAQYCKSFKKEVTVQDVAKLCLVSSSSMYRVIKKLSSHCFKK